MTITANDGSQTRVIGPAEGHDAAQPAPEARVILMEPTPGVVIQ